MSRLNDIYFLDEMAALSSSERITAILKKLPFHQPGFNYTTDGYPSSPLALKLLEDHVKLTKGQVSNEVFVITC